MIPAVRKWSVVLFLTLWLTGWAIGEAVVVVDVLVVGSFLLTPIALPVITLLPYILGAEVSARDVLAALAGCAAVVLVWLPFWTFAGLVMIYAVCWNLRGRETIVFGPEDVTVDRECGPFHRTRRYGLAGVYNLRYAPLPPDLWKTMMPFRRGALKDSWSLQLQMFGVDPGRIAFECEGKTVRFGNDLGEPESHRLIATIQQHIKIPYELDCRPMPVER